LANHPDQTALFVVHYGSASDPFYASSPEDNQARLDYYGISAFPTVMMDGLYDCWPLATMQGYFDTRMAVPCYLAISIAAVEGSSETSGTLQITLATDIGIDTDATINAMLTESGIEGTGTYASQGIDYNYGLRDNLFGSAGQTVSFGASPETLVLNIDYTIDAAWAWDQLYLTTFVQSPVDDQVLNSSMLKMSDLLGTGIQDGQAGMPPVFTAGPSPSSGSITVFAEAPGQTCIVSIYSMDGRLVAETGSSATVQIGSSGVYVARLRTSGGFTASRTVVVIR
jgi:hypothetical protein